MQKYWLNSESKKKRLLCVCLINRQIVPILGIVSLLLMLGWQPALNRPIEAADKEHILFQQKSEFGMVTVKQRGKLRVLVLGKKDQTIYNPAQPATLLYTYTRLMAVGLSTWPKKNARVLLIGLGGGSLVHYIQKNHPDFQLDVVELNPVVHTAAMRYFNLPTSSKVYIEDGRKFVENKGPSYDIIMLDAYDENYIPPSLLTLEFLTAVKSRLSDDGMLIVNTWQTDTLSDHETATYLQLFDNLYDLRFPGKTDGNRILITGKKKIPNVVFVKRVRDFLADKPTKFFPVHILNKIQLLNKRTASPGRIITDKNVKSILGY